MTKDTRQPPRRPASRIVEHATPFGRYVQITDFGDGVTEIIPVIERPTLLHKLQILMAVSSGSDGQPGSGCDGN